MKFILIIFCVLSRTSFAEGQFKIVPSEGMSPTINAGDYVWTVKELDYSLGDIVLFKYPLNEKMIYMKRVVAIGIGQFIEGKNWKVVVNGKELFEEITDEFNPKEVLTQKLQKSNVKLLKAKTGNVEHFILHDYSIDTNKNFKKSILQTGKYFLVGDNRDYSVDSRVWGTAEFKHIIDKVKYVYYQNRSNSDLIDVCMVKNDSQACYFLGVSEMTKKNYIESEKFAKKSCLIGHDNGCIALAAALKAQGRTWEAINTLNILCAKDVVYACRAAIKIGSSIEANSLPEHAFDDMVNKELGELDQMFEDAEILEMAPEKEESSAEVLIEQGTQLQESN